MTSRPPFEKVARLAARSSARRYGVAVAAWLVALALVSWLRSTIGSDLYFPPFTGAVMVAAWFGGLGPGLLATALATAGNAYFFAEPLWSFGIASGSDAVRVAVFVAVAIGISLLAEARNRLALHAGQSGEWLRVTLTSIGDAVIVTDASGLVTFVNRVAESLTGWPLERALGRPLADVFHIVNERTRLTVEDPVRKVLEQGKVVGLANHTILIRPDGSEVFIDDSAAPVRDADGALAGVVLVFRDVTARRGAEIALERQNEELHLHAALIDQAYDAIFVRDENDTIVVWNHGAEQLYGWSREEALGRNPHELLRTAFPVSLADVNETLAAGRPWQGELVHSRRDGSAVVVDSKQAIVRGAKSGRRHVLEINRDITPRRKAEDALRASEAMLREQARELTEANRLKDDFLATLSHELRTPLNAIRGWAQLLLTGHLDAVTTARAYETIDRNARAQTQLINDILDVSRIVTGKLRLEVRPVDLAEVLNAAIEVVRPALEGKRIAIVTRFDRAPALLVGDPDRLQQVFWNLLTNAVKFTQTDGEIAVNVASVDSRLEVRVRDKGIGIKPEFLPHLFRRFSQADSSTARAHGGLGLGLAIVRHLVELHGGTVRAESDGEGRGATFVIGLPVRAVGPGDAPTDGTAQREEEATQGPRPYFQLRGLRVLIVDDEVDARDLLGTVLSRSGARVRTSASAREALEALDEFRPDVLICDIGMPGEDGYWLMRSVRARSIAQGGGVPAIALTAYARPEDRARALEAGYQLHVPKPVLPGDLLAAVAGLAGREPLPS